MKEVNVYSFNDECYVYLRDYRVLQKENEQLKEKMNETLDRNIKYNVEIVDLQQENQQLKDRINKAIFYMENYISVEEYNEPVKCEFGIVIKLLKGDKE